MFGRLSSSRITHLGQTRIGNIPSPHNMSQSVPSIISKVELPTSDAKWITLKKVNWKDQDGKPRVWEVSERKTRGSGGIDAVAILPLLRSPDFPLSTVIIEQYRPPVENFVVELPAGLIDGGETPEDAAKRELEEETGYKATGVVESSSIIVPDPGMSAANFKLVVLDVKLAAGEEPPLQKLDDGEHIVKRIVELSKLYAELKSYDERGYIVDAKLHHFAFGYDMATKLARGQDL